ncbi:polynucleotide adenylyltransferase [Polynucleobacter paneuropaeus]|uniref:Polynucleotide adenylyltransferase n=1 Tax=Polynucleobacter paneuropaeus TaxID=2527775 RepID=A0AAE2YKV0_9BURK|nr:polynucleotide adenylyltransferase [Polynucleobacter paneuropaeus]MBT8589205.1 polynucleotide adenylyltransferase [Polynucleobacter paneuropaeus]MBT8591424.1 polynucleotide adenylyltransferase [Polynucleobacter paneuropaeus]MBT8596814.1 polynucleotide adenylyltransferase [Polynucleobacter paneuropaeus]MBT8598627.1 polynucleotide adenylyltransferase [Polynucleobacter paneuropaeus]
MKTYAVGGAIRDTLMGIPAHDIDYVVVGATVEEMVAEGFRPVGKDFPVFLHPATQAEYALARTERKTGAGYKGFVFHADPSVTLEQDLERRDLTINAMAQELSENGEWVGPIIDPFNGQEDLAKKILRHVSDAFAEDPLRLLRVARFAARFPEFIVADETLLAIKAIVRSGELAALSSERIWQELARGLTATKPMRMFQVLLDAGAAKLLLPSSLNAQLIDEQQRETLRKYLRITPPVLEERCAVVLMNLSATEIRAWSEAVKMPNEVRDFSEIFSELKRLLKHRGEKKSSASEILAWFNRADVWRKPERAMMVLTLAKQIGFEVNDLIQALQKAQALELAQCIADLDSADRNNGEKIRLVVEKARLAAIAAAL